MEIPIENIYYLLIYAWNKLKEKDIVNVRAEDSTDLLDLFAKMLITGTTHLLKRGLDRQYISYREDTGTLRGKINFPESIKRNLFIIPRAHCEFSELSHNILHNQIIKSTIRRLIEDREIDSDNRDKLIQLYNKYFREIETIALSSQVFSRVRLHRNNFFYDFLLKICELIYEQFLISEKTGERKFKDFLRDEKTMGALFEEFLRNFYRLEQKVKVFDVSREDIEWDAISENSKLLPKMQTDITLKTEDRKIIIEAKYYKEALQRHPHGLEKSIRSTHLYQLFAYLKNLEKKGGINRDCEGILIYPVVEETLDESYMIQGHKVMIKTINLNQNWRNIHNDLLGLIGIKTGLYAA